MHLLVTADTVGGVWTYTRELVTGLVERGVNVTLLSFGALPTKDQKAWLEQLGNVNYHPTTFKLEWMEDSAPDIEASSKYLRSIIRDVKPDLLHLNQFCYGAIECGVPRVVVAHSDVVSWWLAVHGEEPPQTSWIGWYRDTVKRGLAGATAVVAPSRWMLDQVERWYAKPSRTAVIYNGRTPELFNPGTTKEDKIITAGRVWDLGKNARLLLATKMPAPVEILGHHQQPGKLDNRFYAGNLGRGVQLRTQQAERQIADILASAAIYAGTSSYEPFGLAPLEAALSGCALVLSDIPSFHELWDGAAVFFNNNDAEDLRWALEFLIGDPRVRQQYARRASSHAVNKFHARRMADHYMELYSAVAPEVATAA